VASEGEAPRSGAAPKVWPVASGVLALWPESGPRSRCGVASGQRWPERGRGVPPLRVWPVGGQCPHPVRRRGYGQASVRSVGVV